MDEFADPPRSPGRSRRRSPSLRTGGSGWRSRCRRWAGRPASGSAHAGPPPSGASRPQTRWSATARPPWPGRGPGRPRHLRARPPGDTARRLPRGADHFLMVLMADEKDVVILGGKPLGLVMHLGDQRAGGVDGLQAAALRLLATRGRSRGRRTPPRPPRARYRLRPRRSRRVPPARGPRGCCARSACARRPGPRSVEGGLDGLNRPVNPRAVTAGLGEQYASGSRGHVPYGS